MIGSIENTRAVIERMRPEQLKPFAMAHKDDYIILSLISDVQSKRNKMAMQQQAAQANAMPPKVNEQLIQSIQPPPPTDSGLAALPADNITYADGGIVGYADRGLVTPMYPGMIAQEGEGLLPSKTGYEGMGVLEFIRQFGLDAYNKIKNAIPGESLDERLARLRRETYEASAQGRQEKALAELSKPDPVDSMSLPARPADPRWTVGATEKPASSGASSGQRGAPTTKTAPSATTTKAAPAAPAGAPTTAPAEAPSYEELFRKAQTAAGVGRPVDPDAAERQKNADILKAQNEEILADARARKEGLAALLKPREERMAKREAALEKQADVDKNMAIISAGLAMMQSTGKGISGIAEGAAKGLSQYGEAIKLTKAERQKIAEARDAYDEFKYNAENMSQKEITEAKGKIAAGAVAASEKGIEARMARNKESREDAASLFKANVEALQKQQQDAAAMARTQAEIGGRRDVANITAGAMRERAGSPDKQRLAELKSMQTNLQAQISKLAPYGPDKQRRAALMAQLDNVNKQVAEMAGIDTMGAGPGAAPAAPAQNRPPLGSFQK